MSKIRISIYVTPELHSKIAAAALVNGRPMSVEAALFLEDRYKPTDRAERAAQQRFQASPRTPSDAAKTPWQPPVGASPQREGETLLSYKMRLNRELSGSGDTDE